MIKVIKFIAALFKNKKILLFYISIIVLLVVLPLNSAGELNNITILSFRGDYFFHALMFVSWAFFRPTFGFKVFLWFALGLIFAAGSEGIQYLLPWRAYNINDLVANIMGIVLGFLIVSFGKLYIPT